ncbi:MAG TPA: uroporphyrinogen-III synthase [Chloroflexia bacterium]|nr:uroporphyrinogen-III synthase [Chloroflexia bacterium]
MPAAPSSQLNKGQIFLIGAGPGDPALISVRGQELLQQATAVVYDYPASPALLKAASGARPYYIPGYSPEKVSTLLVQLAEGGETIVRLFQGDPYSDEAGGLEFSLLKQAGVGCEVVPGISSGIAAAAYAGIPVTHRDFANSFSLTSQPSSLSAENYRALAATGGTLVFLNVDDPAQLATLLLAAGKEPHTPVALISGASTWAQQTVSGHLSEIASLARTAAIRLPAVMVAGEVAGLRETLRWFDLAQVRPLLGHRVVVTRAREQASSVVAQLTALGADAIEFPVIKIVDPPTFVPMDRAVARLADFDWVVFTSVNGVDCFWKRLKMAGKDARAFAKAKICAIGPATAAALEERSLVPDLIPQRYVAEGILEELKVEPGQKFLLPRADIAREALVEGLQAKGAIVENVIAYSTVAGGEEGPGSINPAELVKLLNNGEIDAVTFTSSSTVRNFARRLATATDIALPVLLEKTTVACIGPITAGTARELGLTIGLEAPEFTIDGLIKSLVEHFTRATSRV